MTDYILFHQFTHHLNYTKNWVDKNRGVLDDETIGTIKTFGSSQLDMYCGSLGVEEILQQVSACLLQQNITNVELYKQWVGDGYKTSQLTDGSSFTLRYINHSKPIHIHPARHVPHTMRIKANSLKSVICYFLMFGITDDIQMDELNKVRNGHLALPPISVKAGIEEIKKVAGMLGIA